MDLISYLAARMPYMPSTSFTFIDDEIKQKCGCHGTKFQCSLAKDYQKRHSMNDSVSHADTSFTRSVCQVLFDKVYMQAREKS